MHYLTIHELIRLEELRKRNPTIDGHRKRRHHQWLTGNIGHPELKKHLEGVMALQRAAANWDQFTLSVQRAYPKLNEQIPLAFPEDIIEKRT